MLYQIKLHLYREVVAPIRNPYRPPAYRSLGVATAGPVLESMLEPYKRKRDQELFRQLVRPTDVFLIGHPKSGNTWMAYMLAKILQKDRADQVTMANVGNHVPVVHGKDSRIGTFEDLPNPRIFRNEYPVHPQLYPKTIYLVRDPRAVLVSYYQMYCVVVPEAPMTLRGFIEEYLRHGYIKRWEPLQRWDRQVLDWYTRAKGDDRIMLVRYEDMVKDRGSVLENVAKFCGISYSEAQFLAVVEQSSFQEMKKSEQKYGAESYLEVKGNRGNFIRRGKTDGWKEEMEPDLIARIESEFASVMPLLGYA